MPTQLILKNQYGEESINQVVGDPPWPAAQTQQIDIAWKKYSDGTPLSTQKARLTKAGNVVTMAIAPIDPVGGPTVIACGADKITTYSNGTDPDNFPVPTGWRPQSGAVYFPWPLSQASGPDVIAFARVNSDGSIDVAKDMAFADFTGDLTGYYGPVGSWNVTAFT